VHTVLLTAVLTAIGFLLCVITMAIFTDQFSYFGRSGSDKSDGSFKLVGICVLALSLLCLPLLSVSTTLDKLYHIRFHLHIDWQKRLAEIERNSQPLAEPNMNGETEDQGNSLNSVV